MDKKRVLFIMPNLNRGGAERVVSTLLNNLSRDKFDINLALISKKGHYLSDLREDIKIIDLKKDSVHKAFWAIIDVVNRIKPDIVFSTLGHLNILLAMAKPLFNDNLKLILREASIPSILNSKEKFPTVFNLSYRVFYPKADRIIAQSNYMKRDLEENFNISSEKIKVINNPIDFNKIQTAILESDLNKLNRSFLNAKKRVIAVGSLEPIKQFDKLIRAFRAVKDREIELFIIGEGSQRELLERLIVENDLTKRVHLLGFQKNPYIYMQKSNLILLTSKFEGFPNALLEAISLGTPALAFKCAGGVEEIIIDGQNGWFVKDGEFKELIEKLQLHINHNLNSTNIKTTAYKKYNLNHILGKYERLFLEVLQ
jgi:glycosyltransferase involved in cell wall biosynthesis